MIEQILADGEFFIVLMQCSLTFSFVLPDLVGQFGMASVGLSGINE